MHWLYNSCHKYHDSFETTEEDKLILHTFPQILSQLVFASTIVINLGECTVFSNKIVTDAADLLISLSDAFVVSYRMS